MVSGIYTWIVQRDGKVPLVYVGQAVSTVKRKREYEADFLRDEPKENARLWRAVRKYGRRAASFNVVYPSSREDLTYWERHFYWHFKDQEALGLCSVANFAVPGDSPMNNQDVRAKHAAAILSRSEDTEWRKKAADAMKAVRQPPTKPYSVLSPEGELHTGTNLFEFCREHGLNQSAMSRVVAGKRPRHKGWTRYVEEELTCHA